ncbi:mucin-3A-like isoform X2 [Crassostrea angulata]|uniref:mucin-3A-like isoform X2 n=1 Tax=Magallana angulata TaxID=2784310 RepID=UPI0022B21B64|nr:mucin-3A-like isoform X2 [Crassostrea angulata]
MDNMASGIPYIGIFFCLALQVVDCCNIFPFDDSRCYVELVNSQYIVRSLPEGTHVDIINCILVSGELHNPHHVHRTECSKALNGHTVYVSSDGINQARSVELKRDTNSSTNNSHSSHHYTCYHGHSYYRDVFREAEHSNCHRTYSVINKLDYLRRNDHNCLFTLVREMAGLRLPNCECSNSSSNVYYSFTDRDDNYHHHHMTNHVYKEIITSYLSHVPYNHGVKEPSSKCHTRNQFWQDLLRLLNSDVYCFYGFIYHMREAFHAHSEPPCTSCHSPTTNTNFDHNYEAYIKGDCLSEHTVWSFLMEENSNHYFGQSREQLVEQMAALYSDGTDNKCICSKKFDLNYPYLPSEDYQWARTCRHSDSHYHTSFANAITHLFGHYSHHHSTQTCHSHAAVWQELNRILKHDHHPVHCLETLVHILQKAVHEHGDPCICNPVASTTRTTNTSTMITHHTPTHLTTTQPTKTTSHPTASTAQSNATAIQQTATTSWQTNTTTHPTASTVQSNTITIQQTTTTSRQTIAQSPSTTEKKTTTAQPTTKTTQKFASITNPTTTTAQPAAMTSQPATAAATQPTFNWVTLKNTSSSTVALILRSVRKFL